MARPRGSARTQEQRIASGVFSAPHEADVSARLPLGGSPIAAPPDGVKLDATERRLFDLLVASLHPNTASNADALALALCAQLGARVHFADEPVSGTVLGKYIDLLRDFGLTPQSRMRLSTAPAVPDGTDTKATMVDFYTKSAKL